MATLLTAAQMRALERAAIESGTVTGLQLMERAGKGVVDTIFDEWPELRDGDRRAVILCGPGNNGGDGFVVARHLKEAGWRVSAFFFGSVDKLPSDARTNYDRYIAMGGAIYASLSGVFNENGSMPRPDLLDADVVIDAVFGIGLSRPLGTLHTDVWQAFDLGTGPIRHLVALDVPSGLCADSGRLIVEADTAAAIPFGSPLSAFQAELTVTFHALKPGHFLQDGPMMCGKLKIVDIGLCHTTGPNQFTGDECNAAPWLITQPTETLGKHDGHKFSYGHALILSGGPGHTGAARLAARGALRVGAGVVTLGVPPAAQFEAAAHLTAIMIKRIPDAEGLIATLADTRINALCLGPAFGLEDVRAELIAAALDATSGKGGAQQRGLVLDADALTLIAKDPALFKMLHAGCVLTPHNGEFARLFPDVARRLQIPANQGPAYSKVDAAQAAASRAGCTLLLKGHDTIIASADGAVSIHSSQYDRATPWLATAGSGDVLAGLITGLLARGSTPHAAAETAAWLHTGCARQIGPGLIAEDLPDALPSVFADLGL